MVFHVGDGIVSSNVGLSGRDIRKASVAIYQQAMCILRLLVHGILLPGVLVSRLEHVIAGDEE